MATLGDLVRKIRRPFRVRWEDLGPPRLDANSQMSRSYYRYGSLVDRVVRIFLAMEPETVERVLQTFRAKYGDGAYAYARRTIGSWKQGQVRQVGQTVMRLLEVVPLYVDRTTRFELAQILREETLRRLRQTNMVLIVATDGDLTEPMARLREIIDAQVSIELPPGVLETQAWIGQEDAAVFQRMIREVERTVLNAWYRDFFERVRLLQNLRAEIEVPVKMEAVFELPTARFILRIVPGARRASLETSLRRATSFTSSSMEQHEQHLDDTQFLAKWSDLELETRFKSGEVSYPEYVLRNMDQFFSPEEQSELHKIAAMHGLELERLLMEIQIKSRTSEADLQKLLTTLKTLQEKNIAADVVSRHETPSGHIEISARSRRRLGCLPLGGGAAMLMIACAVLLR